MSYTRRSFLRNGALLAMAAPTFGCPTKTRTPTRPATFNNGIRIFFAGAWIFCKDPDPTRIRAIALDPSHAANNADPQLKHSFPFGVWDLNLWDAPDVRSFLEPTTIPANSTGDDFTPHMANLTGNWKSMPGTNPLDALFTDANTRSRFTYLNSGGKYSIDWNYGSLRVISLHLPTRIIPAAFQPDADIIDNNVPNLVHAHNPKCSDSGIATTHIFEYEANSGPLTLNVIPTSTTPSGLKVPVVNSGPSYSANFHFHTVPTNPNHDPKQMFQQILSVIKGLPQKPNLAFKLGDENTRPLPGQCVPTSVADSELEIPEAAYFPAATSSNPMGPKPKTIPDPPIAAPAVSACGSDYPVTSSDPSEGR